MEYYIIMGIISIIGGTAIWIYVTKKNTKNKYCRVNKNTFTKDKDWYYELISTCYSKYTNSFGLLSTHRHSEDRDLKDRSSEILKEYNIANFNFEHFYIWFLKRIDLNTGKTQKLIINSDFSNTVNVINGKLIIIEKLYDNSKNNKIIYYDEIEASLKRRERFENLKKAWEEMENGI